jgi:integrase
MSVFKPTGTSTYYFKFQRGGRTFQGSTEEATKDRAKAIERAEKLKAERQISDERQAGRKPMTVDRAFALYADNVLAHLTSGAQSVRELHWIEDQLSADTALSELTNADIETLIAARRACKKRSGTDAKGRPLFKPVTAATVNRTLECLRAALYYARDHHEAFIRPGLNIKKLVEPKERTREASAQDEAAIFAALREDFHDVTRFALLTGVRFFGCVSLTWANVKFETQSITYRKKRKAGRSGDEWGHLPMTEEVEAILRRQIGRHRMQVWTYVSEGKKGGKGGTGRAGIYREGERYPISYWNLQTRWRRALAKAGIADFRFHDLRHTAATRTLRVTGNLKLVQVQLGHAQITTTSKYAHVTNSDLRAGMTLAHEAARRAAIQADPQGFPQGSSKLKTAE